MEIRGSLARAISIVASDAKQQIAGLADPVHEMVRAVMDARFERSEAANEAEAEIVDALWDIDEIITLAVEWDTDWSPQGLFTHWGTIRNMAREMAKKYGIRYNGSDFDFPPMVEVYIAEPRERRSL